MSKPLSMLRKMFRQQKRVTNELGSSQLSVEMLESRSMLSVSSFFQQDALRHLDNPSSHGPKEDQHSPGLFDTLSTATPLGHRLSIQSNVGPPARLEHDSPQESFGELRNHAFERPAMAPRSQFGDFHATPMPSNMTPRPAIAVVAIAMVRSVVGGPVDARASSGGNGTSNIDRSTVPPIIQSASSQPALTSNVTTVRDQVFAMPTVPRSVITSLTKNIGSDVSREAVRRSDIPLSTLNPPLSMDEELLEETADNSKDAGVSRNLSDSGGLIRLGDPLRTKRRTMADHSQSSHHVDRNEVESLPEANDNRDQLFEEWFGLELWSLSNACEEGETERLDASTDSRVTRDSSPNTESPHVSNNTELNRSTETVRAAEEPAVAEQSAGARARRTMVEEVPESSWGGMIALTNEGHPLTEPIVSGIAGSSSQLAQPDSVAGITVDGVKIASPGFQFAPTIGNAQAFDVYESRDLREHVGRNAREVPAETLSQND